MGLIHRSFVDLTNLSDDVGKRFSVFYIIGCFANAFGGILAYGLMQLNGKAGKEGWRWIFIIEGAVGLPQSDSITVEYLTSWKMTCVVASIAYFSLVDFPEKADRSWRFLSKEEGDFIIRRITKDRDDALPEDFTLARFLKPALDLKIWILALMDL